MTDTGSLLPSGNADAWRGFAPSTRIVQFECPQCHGTWQARVKGDDVEPLPLSHPLRKLDNVVLTPHLGYVSQEGYRIYFTEMVEDIKAWLAGSPVRVLKK